jgi:hypothetical protein
LEEKTDTVVILEEVMGELQINSGLDMDDLIQMTKATQLVEEAKKFVFKFGAPNGITAYVNGRTINFRLTVAIHFC